MADAVRINNWQTPIHPHPRAQGVSSIRHSPIQIFRMFQTELNVSVWFLR